MTAIGIFGAFWDGDHPHHLPLLNLDEGSQNEEWNLDLSLAKIESLLLENEEKLVLEGLTYLARDSWRTQLLFCVALLMLKKEAQKAFLEYLWEAIKQNHSFVIPQLAATASLVDPSFRAKAKKLLQSRTSAPKVDTDRHLLIELSRGNSAFEAKGTIAIHWKSRVRVLIEQGRMKTRINLS